MTRRNDSGENGEFIESREASSEFIEFAEVMQGLTTPLAQAQQISAKGATKKAGIIAGTAKVLIILGTYVVATLTYWVGCVCHV